MTPSHVGGRLRFTSGLAVLSPAIEEIPPGMVRGEFSVLSPGTERRRMLVADGSEAGYMSLGRACEADGWTVAPVPHGAAFTSDCTRAVITPPDTPVLVAALARFQQMALLGLSRAPGIDWGQAVVVGSGPVALGMVLELRRRGADRVRVVTSRPYSAVGSTPWVECASRVSRAHVVIDAVGKPGLAASMLAPGGFLGLLGTPDKQDTVPALAAHRGGWTLVGMQELAALTTPDIYTRAYTEAASWLSVLESALLKSWCRTVPGHLAPDVYRLLGTPRRPAEPVVIFDWRTS